jgi:hypothetical protein
MANGFWKELIQKDVEVGNKSLSFHSPGRMGRDLTAPYHLVSLFYETYQAGKLQKD